MDDGRIQVHRVNMYADSEGMCRLPLEYCTMANFEVLAVRFRFLQGQPLFATEAFVGYAGGPQPSTERVFFDLTDPSSVDQEPWKGGKGGDDFYDTDTFVFTGPLALDSDRGTPLGYVHFGDRATFMSPLVEHGVHRGDYPIFGISSFTCENPLYGVGYSILMECTIRILDQDGGPAVYASRVKSHPACATRYHEFPGPKQIINYVLLDVSSEVPIIDGCFGIPNRMIDFSEWEEVPSCKPGWRIFLIPTNCVVDPDAGSCQVVFWGNAADTWSRVWFVAEPVCGIPP